MTRIEFSPVALGTRVHRRLEYCARKASEAAEQPSVTAGWHVAAIWGFVLGWFLL